MKRILYIDSSLIGYETAWRRLREGPIKKPGERDPGNTVTTVDLVSDPLARLGAAGSGDWRISESERTDRERTLASRSDELIDRLLTHEALVPAVPMYNLGVLSTLRAWPDRVARAVKTTFRCSAGGPMGPVEAVRAHVVRARGRIYYNTSLDTRSGYLQGILGLLGIVKVEWIYAEGLAMGEDKRSRTLALAREAIGQLPGRPELEEEYAIA